MDRGRIPLGRIGGIPIGMHWSVLAIFILITELLAVSVLPEADPGRSVITYWLTAASAAVVFLLSLMAHELAHALVARRNGVPVRRITLWLLGGVAEFADEPPNARADLRNALAGPITSAVIGAVGLALAAIGSGLVHPQFTVALVWVAVTNVVIAVFNMLPGAPLDGGRVLRAVLWRRNGDRERSAQLAARSGRALGVVVAATGVLELVLGLIGGLWLLLIAWFLFGAATAELTGSQARQRLAGARAADVMAVDPTSARGWWTVQTFLDRTAAESSHRVFPVVSFDGRPVGTVSLADLVGLDREVRESRTIGDVCRRLDTCVTTTENEPVSILLSRSAVRPGRDLILVLDRGELVGLITPDDLEWTVEHGALGLRAGRRRG